MKISTLVLGIVIGFGFLTLLSADEKPTQTVDASRYHMAFIGTTVFVYDGVTGNYNKVSYGTAAKGENIRDLLEK